MHIHFLGVCGTFMGGLALLAKQMGYQVTGSDEGVYPPMSTQLEAAGIDLIEGFDASQLDIRPDQVVVGNVMTRGHSVIERMLSEQWPMISGPQWLSEHLLQSRWVLAVSGTHGKTTTASMLAWILEHAGMQPGFLIGGVPNDFGVSARIGDKPFFVIEADEYDTAFFDKRSKFVHYQPRTLIINNIEFDHADIFRDLQDVQKQFHHVIKILPQLGKLIFNGDDENIQQVLDQGLWSENESFGVKASNYWHLANVHDKKNPYKISTQGGKRYEGRLSLLGEHNALNAMAAISAARHAGVSVEHSLKALSNFTGVKRRLENKGVYDGITIYDDFAHHPTEIKCTLEAFKQQYDKQRMIVVFEPRSNTMQMGIHAHRLKEALSPATELCIYDSGELSWSIERVLSGLHSNIFTDIERLVEYLLSILQPQDNVLILSNGGFGGVCDKLITGLNQRLNH
ncbi:MAG: UDP-N-acetylmuramate:L-alanyl-gamma-D-glutamyl-meso-diaminopimelate ligase [Gammaproteobacteria bacterium]